MILLSVGPSRPNPRDERLTTARRESHRLRLADSLSTRRPNRRGTFRNEVTHHGQPTRRRGSARTIDLVASAVDSERRSGGRWRRLRPSSCSGWRASRLAIHLIGAGSARRGLAQVRLRRLACSVIGAFCRLRNRRLGRGPDGGSEHAPSRPCCTGPSPGWSSVPILYSSPRPRRLQLHGRLVRRPGRHAFLGRRLGPGATTPAVTADAEAAARAAREEAAKVARNSALGADYRPATRAGRCRDGRLDGFG